MSSCLAIDVHLKFQAINSKLEQIPEREREIIETTMGRPTNMAWKTMVSFLGSSEVHTFPGLRGSRCYFG